MTTSTVWNGSIPSGTSIAGTSTRTDGLQFTVTEPGCSCPGVWFYVPAGETNLTGSSYTGLLWSTTNGATGTQLASEAGSGTFTAGAWNYIPFATPVALAVGTTYEAGVAHSSTLQYVHNYFTSGGPGAGGVTSGPISLPGVGTALDGNQMGTNNSFGAFPNSSTGSWYGVDVSVTDGQPYVVQSAPSADGGWPSGAEIPVGLTEGNYLIALGCAYCNNSTTYSAGEFTVGNGNVVPATKSLLLVQPSGAVETGDNVGFVAWVAYIDSELAGATSCFVGVDGGTSEVGTLAYEVSWPALDGALPTLDQLVTNSLTASGPVTTGPTDPITAAPEFIVGAWLGYGDSFSDPTSGWSAAIDGSAGDDYFMSSYQIATASGGTYDFGMTAANSNFVTGAVFTLKAEAGPSGPSFVQGTSTPAAATATVTLTLEDDPTPGNVLAAWISYSQYEGTRTVSPPSGWTQVFAYTGINSGVNDHDSLALFTYEVQSGDGTGWTFTIDTSGGNDWGGGILKEIADCDTSAPVNASPTASYTNSTSWVSPAATPTALDCLGIAVFTSDGNPGSISLVSAGWAIDVQPSGANHPIGSATLDALTSDTSTPVGTTFTLANAQAGVATTVLFQPPQSEPSEPSLLLACFP